MKISNWANNKTPILLLGIMLVAGFFMFYNLSSTPPGLYPDEAMNGNNALEAIETGNYNAFYLDNNGREGLYINMVAMSIKIFGNEPWTIRLVSTLFGLLTILGMFFLTRELFKNERVALIATFLIATSFWFINFSRIGFRAIMAPFFLVWGFYFLWTLFNDKKSETNHIISAVLGGLFFGLGFHSYIAYRIAPVLLIIPIIKAWKTSELRPWQIFGGKSDVKSGCFWCHFLLFLLFTLIAVAPLGMYYLDNPADFLGRTSQISVFSVENPVKEFGLNIAKTFGMFWFSGDYNWRHNYSGSPQLWWPVGILFIFGIIAGIRRLSLEYWLLFLWIAVMLLPVIISAEGIPHALRAIITIPPIMILSAVGLEKIIIFSNKWVKNKKNQHPESIAQLARIKKLLSVLLVAFFFAIALNTYTQYFVRWGQDINTYNAFAGNYKEIGAWLNKVPNDTKKYVIVNAGGTDVRGIPMPAQTVMFLTSSFTENGKKSKNITYLLPNETDKINCKGSCVITMLENDTKLRGYLKIKIPELQLTTDPGFPVLIK